MNFRKNIRVEKTELMLVPMIDIIFFLLAFFILTWNFARWETQMDITVPTAKESTQSRRQPGEIILNIARSGEVFLNEKPYRSDELLSLLKKISAQFPGQARATTAGEAWRQYRNGPLTIIGGWLLIVAALGIAGMFLVRGPIKLEQSRTGRLIERFTSVERLAHWTMAISFVILALTGMAMLFGKYIILPLFGYTLFGWLAYACKNIHNFVGPVFTISVIVFFIIYVKDNFPEASDFKWLARLGGAIGKGPVSAGRFNVAEKLWFWGGMVVLGLIVSSSGFVLDMLLPGVEYTRDTMQLANVIHVVGAVLIISMSLVHIYVGTIGMEGAYAAMRTGYVDDAWAQQHHDLWYEEIQSGKVPRVRTEEGASRIGVPLKAS